MKKILILILIATFSVSTYNLLAESEDYSIDQFTDTSLNEYNWIVEKIKAIQEFTADTEYETSAPFIMLAGYYDTDITEEEGGTFKMIAYVYDPDGPQDVVKVEIYYQGMPTGVLLYDDGQHGDFGANDQVWGFVAEVPPNTVPAGEYLLELKAFDAENNESDLWPYLTIHP